MIAFKGSGMESLYRLLLQTEVKNDISLNGIYEKKKMFEK